MHAHSNADPRSPAEKTLAEHVELLAEILASREAGSFAMEAGNSDEDLLYALEEVRDAIPAALTGLTVENRLAQARRNQASP